MSTTMRMIVGLDHPTRGTVTVNGRRYDQHGAPLREVGALLDAKAVHTGRSAYNHLLAMGATHGIGTRRIREVIEMTGLELTPVTGSLEDAYIALTQEAVEYRSTDCALSGPPSDSLVDNLAADLARTGTEGANR